MPGNEAAKYLRERNPHMAVLVVAGLLDDDRYTYRADLENFRKFPANIQSGGISPGSARCASGAVETTDCERAALKFRDKRRQLIG